MIRLIMAIVTALALTAPAKAQGTDIQGVISSQIEAFRADDFATAFTYASPMIRGIFRNSDNFGSMVRNGYPMVWRPADVQFKDLKGDGDIYSQRVLIQDGQGVYYLLEYQMIRTENGWRINGVALLEQPPVGV